MLRREISRNGVRFAFGAIEIQNYRRYGNGSRAWCSRGFARLFFPSLTQRSSKSISDDLYSTTEYEIEFYRRYVGEIFMGASGKSALSYVHFLKINVS